MSTGSTSRQSQTTRPPPLTRPSSNLPRLIALAILGIIVVLGLAVLIAWLIVNPKHLSYTIEEGSIKNFNIKSDHLNASYYFLIKAHNPNKRISVYYDYIEVQVSYESQTLAFNTLTPFFQRRHNITELNASLETRDMPLPPSMSTDMSNEKRDTGDLKLRVRLKAKTRYKVGAIRLKRRTLKILCSPITVHFSSSKSFERVYCDLDY